MKVVICETMLRPSVISVPSESKGDGTAYDVVSSTLFNDSFCTCPGYQFRGYCKHITSVAESRCKYYEPVTGKGGKQALDWFADRLGNCPVCGAALILFNMEPEFD